MIHRPFTIGTVAIRLIAFAAVLSLVFGGCSKDAEEVSGPNATQEESTLNQKLSGKLPQISDVTSHSYTSGTSGPLSASTETAEVYFEDFEAGPGGWVPVDFTDPSGVFWHHVPEEGVMWCGIADDPCYATPPGYGNGWSQTLTKSFALGDGLIDITYRVQYDLEPWYDYLIVLVSVDYGATFEVLEALDGVSEGFETHAIDLSMYAGEEVIVRFLVFSDQAWSDEDGLWDTDGACRLDEVQVTGYDSDDFSTGDDGWTAAATPGVGGGPYRLETDLAGVGGVIESINELEVIESINELIEEVVSMLPGSEGRGLIKKLEEAKKALEKGKSKVAVNKLSDFIDQVNAKVRSGLLTTNQGEYLVTEAQVIIDVLDNGMNHAWAAYNLEEPDAGVFPFTPEADKAAGRVLNIGIESPIIPIPNDACSYVLEFDVYRDLPLDNLVFYTWSISTDPLCGFSQRADFNYVYYGTDGWATVTLDITDLVPPGSNELRIWLSGVDMATYWEGIYGSGEYHTPAPFFDNVRIVVEPCIP